MKKKKVGNPSHKGLRVRIKGWSLSQLLRLQRRTWRVHIEGREHLDRLYAANKRFLFCFWHGKYVPIFPLLEGYNACVVSSQSERGSIIAEICRNFGYQSAQIPDQARHEFLRLMKEALSEAQAGGIAVDGPLGPRHRVKSGVIRMASALGLDLLPVSVDSRRKIVFKKRWDRREIPLPFTKVCLVIGEPIKVPTELRPGQVRDLTDNLAETIARLDKKAKNIVRE
ncbi:MAG: DUF374 domain-containing protein [Syntrophales bacterium]|nr:DUF374 domain-containing protein [Syntrophales bacterium]